MVLPETTHGSDVNALLCATALLRDQNALTSNGRLVGRLGR